MIVTPEGLNVFPEDVERRAEPAARRARFGGRRRQHAAGATNACTPCSSSNRASIPDAVARDANAQLADHQKIRRAVVWPEPELPRTEGTRKLKRAAIREWLKSGGAPRHVQSGSDALAALVAKYAGRENVAPTATHRRARAQLARTRRADGRARGHVRTRIDEGAFAEARSVADLKTLVEKSAEAGATAPAEPVDFPRWNRTRPGVVHPADQPADLDPAARPACSSG